MRQYFFSGPGPWPRSIAEVMIFAPHFGHFSGILSNLQRPRSLQVSVLMQSQKYSMIGGD